MTGTERLKAETSQRGLALFVKRAVDAVVAVSVIIVGCPPFLVIAVLLASFQGFPILFRQRRVGFREQPFTMYKFRTMRTQLGPDGRLLPDEQRVTWIGRLLRRTSIDELPQLLNILKGELSLVGNRPLPVEYLARMTPEQRRRHSVLPGMTGLDSVRGRYDLTWEQQFETDVWYVDHWSLWLDAKIVLQTMWVLLRNSNQLPASQATREEFTGSCEPKDSDSAHTRTPIDEARPQ